MSDRMQPADETETLPYFTSLSNWGRWGADDQLGTLNYVAAAQRQAAATLVVDGTAVSCGRPLKADAVGSLPGQNLRLMVESGEGAAKIGWASAAEWLGIRFHGRHVTHLDSLGHAFWNGQAYNGRAADTVTTVEGATVGSVDALDGATVVTRGVLLDVPRSEGIDYVEPGTGVTPAELLRCEQSQGVRLERGDAVLIRTGRDEAERQSSGPYPGGRLAGVSPRCLPLLHEREVALLGSDGVNDPRPSPPDMLAPLPVHAVGIAAMGMWLIDNLFLEDLAGECARRGRWSFCLVVASLRVQGGTGSPVNPTALF